MKNFKHIAFGLLVGAMAIGFSAFTTKNVVVPAKHHIAKAGMITDDFLVQSSSNTFTQNSAPSASHCRSTATLQCIYDVTETGASNIPDQASYSSSDINTYVSNGWLTADASSKAALYQ